MKTKTMKTIQLWMLALVLTISNSTALTSCSKEDIVVPQTEQQPVILKGEAALAALVRNRTGTLLECAIKGMDRSRLLSESSRS